MSDIVKRLHRQIILIETVGGDPDLKIVLEEAEAEIARLREERLTPDEREAVQLSLELQWPLTMEQWGAFTKCHGPMCQVPANRHKVAIRAFLARQQK